MPPDSRRGAMTTQSQTAPAPQLPSGFATMANAPVNAEPTEGVFDAYIWVASAKSKQFPDMVKKCPGLIDGDIVYVSQGHTEILRKISFHLMTAAQYWARKNPTTGQPMSGVQFTDPGDRSKDEYIDAVVVIQTSKGLLPARWRFKSGLVGAINPAIEELKLVQSDLAAWSTKSASHEVASKLPVPAPGFRFVTDATFAMRTAKGSGLPYIAGRGQCRPITPDDGKLIGGLADAKVAKLCELVAAEHQKRLEDVKKLPQ